MINISYNYEILIKELKEEIKHKMLNITDTIQVLRDSKNTINGYKPIIDWYYNDNEIIDILNPDLFDTQEETTLSKALLKQYLNIKPYLEEIIISNCLIEMEEWNKMLEDL